MPDYDAMKAILGKTITGVIVKKGPLGEKPAVAVHRVFDDDTSYEIYTDYHINFAGGLNHGGMEWARRYDTPPKGPMTNVLDISVDGP